MPKLGPVSWKELVRKLRFFGFDGPFAGGRHLYMTMTKDDLVLTIPNPHGKDIGQHLLQRLLKQAGINRKDWLKE